jgi:hypothetical protein
MTKVLDMVPDLVNRFYGKSKSEDDVVEEAAETAEEE